jgi:hypothetical protein
VHLATRAAGTGRTEEEEEEEEEEDDDDDEEVVGRSPSRAP